MTTFIRSYELLAPKAGTWSHHCMACGLRWNSRDSLPVHQCKAGSPRWTCRHLGEETGETITVTCRCKNATTRRSYAVHRCAVMGRALPAYRCTKHALAEEADGDATACRQCESFEAKSDTINSTQGGD